MENGNRDSMILIIPTCKNKLHYLEFVKPIEVVLKKNNIKFETMSIKEKNSNSLKKCEKIIITGTSLKDLSYQDDLKYFNWIKKFEKPILGICGGNQILGLLFDGQLKKTQEIGLTNIRFKKEFFGMSGTEEVYELHNFYVESDMFETIAESENCPQVIKHKNKPFYGVLFHPEVRNKEMLVEFALH